MLVVTFAFLLGVAALGSQVALAKTFKFSFENDNITQCAPVSISFQGSDIPEDSIPVNLTLLPLNAPPIGIPIPNLAINSSGVYITFFPLKAGTTFIASLDDQDGDSTAQVSDLFRILDSDNTACLPSNPDEETLFTYDESVDQCGNFTVQYATPEAPSVRLWKPKGQSFLLQQTSDNTVSKQAIYTMNFSRQNDVVLLFDSGPHQQNTSSLITVTGDATTSRNCLSNNNTNSKNGTSSQDNDATTQSTMPKNVVIGVGVASGLVGLVSILAIIFVIRERRRRKQRLSRIPFVPDSLYKPRSFDLTEKGDYSPFGSPELQHSDGIVVDPPYALASYSPSVSNFSRGSGQSWDIVSLGQTRRGSDGIIPMNRSASMNPLDIEGMLNMAANQNNARPISPAARSESSFSNLGNPQSVSALTKAYLRSETPQDSRSSAIPPFAPATTRSSTVSAHVSHASSNFTIKPLQPQVAVGLPSSPQNRTLTQQQPPSSDDGRLQGIPLIRNRDTVSSWGNVVGLAK
ncbi:uncharacterized protein BT62DRAFT_353323 [Guyanagaster necrorhizus]|uniref:Uncharacterized protein n=1 Tax=Guyanagaster necrorhizus TaxID=856835 RepID=A0A9P7VM92_9AGAR|nr:uncharacterized protein BT62DRAFT_353323 [Guyanagaster necrorhizus MCA 3950]KAG7443123.1 hypothetical protein BT62DRAFT_353323 [Guyanagaster necrorhizus MCA 3950]